MSTNYAQGRSTDGERTTSVDAPSPVLAKARWTVENGVTSSVVSLNPNTTSLEIGATGGQGVVIKWIPITDTTQASVISSGLAQANFDHWVPPGMFRSFVVPKETAGLPINPNVQIVSIYGLYQRVAWMSKGATASSIIATEY